jgi:uncharacterized protein
MIDPALFARLRSVAEARCEAHGPAHDFSHVLRVVENARRIATGENADVTVATVAALLHELFNHPKAHPESHRSGDVCAEHAEILLRQEQCPPRWIEPICAAIRAHAFSKGMVPEALEGKVLQDADRLDAIGAIGIARCMATCAEMRRPFYSPDDPFCRTRAPDDKAWGIDHFYKKLLRIPEGLHTETARDLAEGRMQAMQSFLAQLASEI